MEQVSQEIFRRILLSLARSTTRVQKSHLFNLVCKWVPFLPLAGCALVKVAVAQTQDLCTVSIHGTGGGGEPLLAKPNRVQAPPHYGITQKWRQPGTHPIPLCTCGCGAKRCFFGDKKLLLGKKCQKFFHPASETLRQTSDRVQSPDGHTVGSEDSRGS